MQKHGLRAKVASKIKSLRLKQKITQEKVAEKAAFHYKYYQRIESGAVNLTLDSLERLARAFKCKASDLLP